MAQISFFDTENMLDALSKQGDPLEKLNALVDWAIFSPTLKKAIKKEKKSNAGRPSYDYLMMFKILVLQRLYNMSDAQIQFQIIDRYSFKRFLGISSDVPIPDEKTIWLFRETLTKSGSIEKLFRKFNSFLDTKGFSAKKGQIVDASFVEVPKQRNTLDENIDVKNGKTPSDWEAKSNKNRQKDKDARWTQKNGVNHYGYKNHINTDVKNKLIRDFEVTSAEVHDSRVFKEILDNTNTGKSVWADSAYYSEESESMLKDKGYKSEVCKREYRNTPLSKFQLKLNTIKSKTRCRVEHIFGFMENSMHTGKIRCIGKERARGIIGLVNLVYNLKRYTQIA